MKNMKNYITKDLNKHLQHYFDLIYNSKLDLEIDGVLAFNEKSQFVEGKVVNACSYLYENLDLNGPFKQRVGEQLKEIIDIMSERVYETWGILNCITALNRLTKKGLFNVVISDKSLINFKEKLDWRTFVKEDDLTLIDKPANYYGVAFGIARYRELLGFESKGWSDRLLKKLLKHVDDFSGEFSYMDETAGEGRFDRYSILIPGEICALLYETECEIPKKLIVMLRKSCDIFINLASKSGEGVSYGRSIGAYGDTAILETLSIAANLGVLTPDELEIAYGYNTFTVKRFSEFWIDSETKSLNIWDKGRRTDDYRNKNRILGENLSLVMQIINSYEFWKKSGFESHNIIDDFNDKLLSLPTFSKYVFADGEYARNLYIRRDGEHVISLPIINGGHKYYKETPYLPIPNEFGVFSSAPNSSLSQLMPKITLRSGIELMPTVYIKNIKDSSNVATDVHRIEYYVDGMVIIDGMEPKLFKGPIVNVEYILSKGQIECNLDFNINGFDYNEIERIEMLFGSFSTGAKISDCSVVYGIGSIRQVEAIGFNNCENIDVNGDENYSTPVGQIDNETLWTLDSCVSNEFRLGWKINYI